MKIKREKLKTFQNIPPQKLPLLRIFIESRKNIDKLRTFCISIAKDLRSQHHNEYPMKYELSHVTYYFGIAYILPERGNLLPEAVPDAVGSSNSVGQGAKPIEVVGNSFVPAHWNCLPHELP